jgi:hypothetical protein
VSELLEQDTTIFTGLYMPVPLREQINELAAAHDRSLSGEIREAIRTHVSQFTPADETAAA